MQTEVQLVISLLPNMHLVSARQSTSSGVNSKSAIIWVKIIVFRLSSNANLHFERQFEEPINCLDKIIVKEPEEKKRIISNLESNSCLTMHQFDRRPKR